MAKTKFKYSINHQLSLAPRVFSIGDVAKILADEFEISRDTFYRDRAISVDSDTTIPIERLEIYASLFGVHPSELKNFLEERTFIKNLRELAKDYENEIQKPISEAEAMRRVMKRCRVKAVRTPQVLKTKAL